MLDPRQKNYAPPAKNITEYLNGYASTIEKAVRSVSAEKMELVFSILREKLETGAQIFAAGNGGSAAIAAHLCCDWTKSTRIENEPSLRVQSLMENTSLLTALANDISYEDAVAEQLKLLAKEGDAVILLSCSGNSPNMIRAAQTARKMEIDVISLTGFDGGKLLPLSDIGLHVPLNNYGMIEDSHQMLMHVLTQYLYLWRVQQKDRRPSQSTHAQI